VWWSWGISPLILSLVVDGCERQSSCPSRFIPGERNPGRSWISGSVGHSVILDAVGKRIVLPVRRIEIQCHSCPSVSHVTCWPQRPGIQYCCKWIWIESSNLRRCYAMLTVKVLWPSQLSTSRCKGLLQDGYVYSDTAGSVRPSVRMSVRLPLDAFMWCLLLGTFLNIYRRFPNLVKWGKNIEHFAWGAEYALLLAAKLNRL
jgi:hypothetical protein